MQTFDDPDESSDKEGVKEEGSEKGITNPLFQSNLWTLLPLLWYNLPKG